MESCAIYFGGVPPGRGSEYVNFDFGNFLGSMRSLTISNPGSNSILNPLYALRHSYNPYFGIEPNCERKVRGKINKVGKNVLPYVTFYQSFQTIKTVSFDGSGFLEVDSHGIRGNSSIGFTFRTSHDSGLILFSGSGGGDDDDSGDFYSVSMSQGGLVFNFGRGGFGPMQFRYDKKISSSWMRVI